MKRRLAAVAALVLLVGSVALAAVLAAQSFPRGLSVLLLALLSVGAGWYGVLRKGVDRIAGLGVAALLLAAALVLLASEGRPLAVGLVVAGLVGAVAMAQVVFRSRANLASVPAPRRAVLFFNPLSGGGKAERFRLAAEASRRGIKPVELHPGDDLPALVTEAIEHGADALAMAGGDGSQAIVATMAAENDLPYACIPAGTRNHFALDLGVDRDDVVGALDALVSGRERRVDLAEVNGRIFVNNVSLGVYAEAVQRGSYRDAKLRTILGIVPEVLGPAAQHSPLRWEDSEGNQHRTRAAILVSNNPYRLGLLGSGTRPRLDAGRLGIAAIEEADRGEGAHRRAGGLVQWSVPEFTIHSERQVAAGIDGEAMMLTPPLSFRVRPGALRVLIAPTHPGASPSARIPDSPWAGIGTLARTAAQG